MSAVISQQAVTEMFPALLDVQPGATAAKYSCIKVVGSGVSGTAFLFNRSEDGKKLIAKVTNLSNMTDKKKMYARTEILCLARCHHFAIIGHHEDHVSPDGSHLLLVMELADAGDLNRQIKARGKAQPVTYFKEHEVAFLFLQIVMAVDYIHRNRMIHRDIKSANIFLMSCGITKLGDFGFSQLYEDTVSSAVAGTFCGTPYYLAPELWRRQRYSKKADVWSLGIVLYEMAALKRPFTSDTMVGLMDKVMAGTYDPLPPDLSNGMCDLVQSLLQFDPNARPSTKQILALPYMTYVVKQFEASVKSSVNFSETDKTSIFEELQIAQQPLSASESIPVGEVVNSVKHKGSVLKEGSRGWKSRFLVLASGELTISLVESYVGETRTVPLAAMAGVLHVKTEEKEREHVFTIELAVGADPLFFQAESAESAEMWVEKLQAALGLG
jgi:serine/threonine protein kinase